MDTQIIDKSQIKPNKGYLLLEVPDAPVERASGVLVAEDNNDRVPMMGNVLATAEGSTYQIGDKILFRRYSVDELKIKDAEGEKKIYLLEEENVLATIK